VLAFMVQTKANKLRTRTISATEPVEGWHFTEYSIFEARAEDSDGVRVGDHKL